MIKKTLITINSLVALGKWAAVYRVVFLLTFIFPGMLLAFFSYTRFSSQSTQSILSQKKLLAFLAASIVHDRLKAIMDLGVLFATRPRVIEEIEKGTANEMTGFLERLRRGEKIENHETVRSKKDGGFINVDLTISPIKNELGRSRALQRLPAISPAGRWPKKNVMSCSAACRMRSPM